MEKTKKNILKKIVTKSALKKEWSKYPELREAEGFVDSLHSSRSPNGYLRAHPGEEKEGFGNKLKDPKFLKALRSFQEDKKISMFA